MNSRLLAVVASIGLIFSTSIQGCGGDYYEESLITPEHHVTAADLDNFAHGEIGVVPGTYWRVYQFLAYRALSGHPLPGKDASALDISSRGHLRGDDVGWGVSVWVQARMAVTGAKPVIVEPEVYADDYVYFTNCMDDAFAQATATLKDRLKRGGQRWAASWLARQDAVFANCGATKQMPGYSRPTFPGELVQPGPLELDAPSWLAHDRDYQMAAALFYAGSYDKARAAFLAISKNTQSSWQPMAAYLAARCLVRKASLMKGRAPEPNQQQDPERIALLEQARKEMHAAEKSFPAGRGLANALDARLQPQRRVEELAKALVTAKPGKDFGQMLNDYLLLMNNVGRHEMIVSPQGLSAWIGTMQATHEDDPYAGMDAKDIENLRRLALETARKWYAVNRETLWLLPILTNAHPGELTQAEVEAAAAVPPNAPAYQTLHYHLARLALEEGRADEADDIVTTALKGSKMSFATRNRWLGLKLLSAKNLDEFLLAAARRYIAEPGRYEPTPAKPRAGEKKIVGYEGDFAQHIFRDFPLAELKALRLRADFPEIWKKTLGEVIWTRAVVFQDYATADELTDELAKGRNSTRHLYDKFKAAATPEEKHLAAMIILVNSPRLHPVVGGSLASSWGCRESKNWEGWSHSNEWQSIADGFPPYSSLASWNRPNELQYIVPNAIDKESRDRAQMEQKQLAALPIRTRYLAPALLAWAKQNPKDPEAPKSLHLLVESSRMECSRGDSDKGKSNHSREAFQLLHRFYPKSSWAEKTPYYF